MSDAARVFADSGPAQVPMAIVGTWADLSTPSLVQGVGGTAAYTDGSGYARIPANIAAHDPSELTISFYYRPESAVRHILLAVGGGAQVGDLVIEVRANGKLRGYHVGQDGVRRFFESRSGITGSDLRVGQAYRIDLTLGASGARIYLDGVPLTNAFILANRNGWNNTRIKRVGVRADGAFDDLRIWDRQLSAEQIATLEPAQSITLGPAPVAQELSVPSLAEWLVSDESNPTATKFVSNQNRGNGSGSSPANAQEVQAALNGASPGQVFQAVCQTPGTIEFWNYPSGLAFPSGTSGNYITLEARQGDGIVLSRCEDFAAFRTPNSGQWTQSGLSQADIDKRIWRSVGTVSGGAQALCGWWIEFDHPHQLVQAGSMANLRAAYGTANSPTNYSGPMVHKDTDNRVYIRMQRPHPGKYSLNNKFSNHIWPGHPEAYSGGQISYPINENPNSYKIYIQRTQVGVKPIANSANWVILGNGINTVGYAQMASGSHLQFHRGVDYVFTQYMPANLQTDWFLHRRRITWGATLHLSRAEWKFGGWLEVPFRSAVIPTGGGAGMATNMNFKDCTICDFHELATGGPGGHHRFRNCTFWHGVDDGFQTSAKLTRVEFGYCFFFGNAYGGYGFSGTEGDDPNPGGWFFHHNIVDVREERCTEWRAQAPPKFPYSPHSPDGSQPHKNYNNTIFWGPDIANEIPLGLGHLTTSQNFANKGPVPHEVFNNIGIRQVWNGKRYDPLAGDGYVGSSGSFANRCDYAWGPDCSPHPDRSNEFWDYNLWYRDLDGTAAVNPYIIRMATGANPSPTATFTSLANWKASALFQASKQAGAERGAYSPGFEGNGTDVRPTIPSLDNFPADRLKYRPAATSAVTVAKTGSLTGANWWTNPPTWGTQYFPWNDGPFTLAPSPWKGALDPNGTTIPVGVQNP